ncbi:MAG: DUF2786 domain-containing protein [Deltaproteobacteria bacterium]|nr:DUF2786 domain-containing protein [Deltaproteobacteria bacterium]
MEPASSLPPDRTKIKNSFLRLLQREHARLIGRFPAARPALLDIRPLERSWGMWMPDERVIAISERLLDQCRWLPVQGILGHETAHQLVHDLYPLSSAHEPPHGPTFLRICRTIHLDPFYWRASMNLDGRLEPPCPLGPDPEDEELKPVLDKVKKLLALAGSDNTNESALALSAAERILARYSIDPEKLTRTPGDEPFRRLRLPLPGGRATLRHTLVLNILTEFFGLAAVFTWNYDPSTAGENREIELLGRPMNLAMGEYVWAFLNERCETLWQAYRPEAWKLGEKGIGAKNAFIHSLLRAFASKMRDARVKDSEEAGRTAAGASAGASAGARRGELAETDNSLDEYVKAVYPFMRRTWHRSSAVAGSPNAAGAGTKAGRELSIRPPVRGGGASGPAGLIG